MERIETKNLVLRKATENDLEAIWKNIWQDESIARWMYWQPTKAYEDAVDRLERTIRYQSGNHAYFVCLKETDEAIGFAGIKEVEPKVFEESGICVAAKYQNLGYGTEILQALMQLAFEEFDGEKFIYACMKENERSRKVCQKFGFRYSHSQDEVRQWDGARFVNDFYYLMRDEYKNGCKDTKN